MILIAVFFQMRVVIRTLSHIQTTPGVAASNLQILLMCFTLQATVEWYLHEMCNRKYVDWAANYVQLKIVPYLNKNCFFMWQSHIFWLSKAANVELCFTTYIHSGVELLEEAQRDLTHCL